MEFKAPEKSVIIVDPRMRINQDRTQAVLIGPRSDTYRPISADTNLSVSTVNFNYNVTSVMDIIDRLFFVKYYLQIVISGTGNPLTAHGVSDSLRFLPINSSCTSLQVTINNSSVTDIPYQWLDGLSRYIPQEVLREDLSSSPSQPDLFYSYALASGPKNVMGSYTDNSVNSPDLRGSIVPVSITEGNNQSTFQFEIIEPLFISPLFYKSELASGLIGVESLSVQLTHDWSLASAWSHTGATTLSGGVFSMYNTPELLVNVMSPNRLVEPYDPMKTYVYNYASLRHYATQAGVINSGATSVIASGNIQLNCIPSLVYVFARKAKASRAVGGTDPDTFLRITNMSISMGNKTGLLSSASERDLYKIAKKNGYQYSFQGWHDYQGGVLCLNAAEDLSLDEGEAPGLVVQKQLQMNVTVFNQTANNDSVELIIVPVLPGAFMIHNGTSTQSVGLLDAPQVFADSAKFPMITGSERLYPIHDIYGSGIFDVLKSIARHVIPAISGPLAKLAERGIAEGAKYLTKKVRGVGKKGKAYGRGLMIDYDYEDEESLDNDDIVISTEKSDFRDMFERRK